MPVSNPSTTLLYLILAFGCAKAGYGGLHELNVGREKRHNLFGDATIAITGGVYSSHIAVLIFPDANNACADGQPSSAFAA